MTIHSMMMILKSCSRTLSTMCWTTMMKPTWSPWTPMMSMKSLTCLECPFRNLSTIGWQTY